jgi:methoxymalonate biosynthesis acyl carrier protein
MTKPSQLDRLERQISALFIEKLNVQVPSVETDLIETGLVDSLMFVQFLAELEESFDVRVSLEDLEIEHFRTITRIASFVAAKRRPVATEAATGP